jgi:hypothetical protein
MKTSVALLLLLIVLVLLVVSDAVKSSLLNDSFFR